MTVTSQTVEHDLLKELPILPTVLVELLGISLDDENYFDKIEALAERDPPLAIKIIKLSNTARQTTVKPILSIKEAIIRMGCKEVFNLISLVAVTKVFVANTESEKHLWHHALQVAEIVKESFELLPKIAIATETAYLIGLLHDIGLFLVDESQRQDFPELDAEIWNSLGPNSPIYRAQRRHAAIGTKVCKHWGIPSPIPEVIYFHHHFSMPEQYRRYRSLVETIRRIQFADIVSEIALTHNEFDDGLMLEVLNQHTQLKPWLQSVSNLDSLFEKSKSAIDVANSKFDLLYL